MIEVQLSRLAVIDGHDQQIVQLRERYPVDGGDGRQLTMVIGPHEAAEIARCVQNAATPRPLTHELAFRLVGALDGAIQEAVIHDLQEGVYFAELRIDVQGAVQRVDCRPSDALALSLRGGTPMYVSEEVLEAAQGGESF